MITPAVSIAHQKIPDSSKERDSDSLTHHFNMKLTAQMTGGHSGLWKISLIHVSFLVPNQFDNKLLPLVFFKLTALLQYSVYIFV